jgi:hypothetical protein
VITADFRVYAFDSAAFEVKVEVQDGKRPTLSDWEKAFKFIKADGSTSIGSAMMKLLKDRIYVEQLAIVTDGEENTAPYLARVWAEYAKEMAIAPSVIIVQVGAYNPHFVRGLQGHGIEVMAYQFGGQEYYALPNLLPLLALPSKAELVDAIMQYGLPRRQAS